MAPKRLTTPNKNDAFAETNDVNETILKEVHEAYIKTETGSPLSLSTYEPEVKPSLLKPGKEGIMAICSKLGLACIAPRRKINVMIIGNHSAGKSSFINWYIGEKIQKAAVAIETQGFTFCTSGKKRDTLKGQATLQLFQHLIPDLQKFAPGIYNGVQTEVSTSKSKCFNLITFIDTPGLVDGSFQYPFPVEDAIVSVAKHTDLIYIFFDPIGQALCDRTMKVIEMLQKEHADKIRYFLSKADTVPDEMDRQKVVVQITQNLSSRVRNAHAFELPSIYIPEMGGGECKVHNALDQTCEQMEQTISQSVQNNLNNLEGDCKIVRDKIDSLLAEDKNCRVYNRSAFLYGYSLFFASMHVPVFALAVLVTFAEFSFLEKLNAMAPEQMQVLPALNATTATLIGRRSTDGAEAGWLSIRDFLLCAFILTVGLYVASRILGRYKPYYSKQELKNLQSTKTHVMGELLDTKERLYKLYLDQCASDLQ